MKFFLSFLSTTIVSFTFCVELNSQTGGSIITKNINISINRLEANVTRMVCEPNKLNLSFPVENHGNVTCKVEIKIRIGDRIETFSFTNPQPYVTLNGTKYYDIGPNQSRSFNANINVKNNWIIEGNKVVKVEVLLRRPDGAINLSDPISGDNSKETSINFSGVPRPESNFCICDISNSVIDTSSLYILQGSIKRNNSGNQITLATLAMNTNSNIFSAVLSKEFAAKIKFKFVGYYNSNNTIPMYNIVFANNLYCLTKDETSLPHDLIFEENIGSDAQKWILKKNSNGSYSIFNAGSISLSCSAIGSLAIFGPTFQQPYLLVKYSYDFSNQFEQFELIKLE